MPLGLPGAFGASAIQSILRQRMQDQLDAEARQRHILESDRSFGLQQQEANSNEALKRDALLSNQQNRQVAQGEAQFKGDMALSEQTAPGSEITQQNPIAGRLMRIGALQDRGIQAEQPPAAIAANPDEAPQEMPGTIANSPMPEARSFTKLPTTKQKADAATEADRKKKEADDSFTKNWMASIAQQKLDTGPATAGEPLEQVSVGGKPVYMPRSQAAGQTPYHQPQAQQTVTIQTVDEGGMPVTKIVPKTPGATYSKPPSAVTANRLDSAQAVEQTGNDIIARLSDPAFKAVVGPAMGRAASLQDFIGNPPPEFSELAGQIESYALANMGVHGMRSAQGAEQIKHLLTAHHTPESLIAAVKGLNGFSRHFMENAGRERDSRSTDTKGGIPKVGETFQGGKVLSIEKVP